MSTHEFSVDLLITPSHSFFDGAGIMAGLVDLRNEGTIRLRIRRGDIADPKHSGIVQLNVTHTGTGKSHRVVIDVADRGDYFSKPLLESADAYFKRSYSPEMIRATVPEAQQQRIKPYGLNLVCLGAAASTTYIRAAATLLSQRIAGPYRKPIKEAVAEFAGICRMVRGLPSAADFEGTSDARAEEKVILQTRVWPPEPSVDNLGTVNNERIALTRALKDAFAERFVGGITVDAFSQDNCPPDLLVRHNMKRPAYVRLVKAASIGVYTRGLHYAIAIRMAEYMAAGLCIVSEPLKFELPAPLVEGVNYLVFRDHEECVARCQWLMAHPAEAAKMRAANLAYFRKWTTPRELVRNLLSRSCA